MSWGSRTGRKSNAGLNPVCPSDDAWLAHRHEGDGLPQKPDTLFHPCSISSDTSVALIKECMPEVDVRSVLTLLSLLLPASLCIPWWEPTLGGGGVLNTHTLKVPFGRSGGVHGVLICKEIIKTPYAFRFEA